MKDLKKQAIISSPEGIKTSTENMSAGFKGHEYHLSQIKLKLDKLEKLILDENKTKKLE